MLVLFDLGSGADHYPASARGVSLKDARRTVDGSVCREVRTFDVFHKLGNGTLGVIHTVDSGVNDLTEIVGRDICRHTDSDSDSSIYKEVREAGGKNAGLSSSVIEVRHKVNDLFFKVSHKRVSYLRHSRLGVTVSRSTVSVNRTEVSVTFNKGISV